MNRKRAFCTNELLIVIAVAALGMALFMPALKFLLTHHSPPVVITTLLILVLIPLGALPLARWADRHERYDLSDIYGLILHLTALPGIGCAIGLLFFLSKAVQGMLW